MDATVTFAARLRMLATTARDATAAYNACSEKSPLQKSRMYAMDVAHDELHREITEDRALLIADALDLARVAERDLELIRRTWERRNEAKHHLIAGTVRSLRASLAALDREAEGEANDPDYTNTNPDLDDAR